MESRSRPTPRRPLADLALWVAVLILYAGTTALGLWLGALGRD